MLGLCIFLLTFSLTWFTSIYNNLHKLKQNIDKKYILTNLLKSNINEGSHPTCISKNQQPAVTASEDRPPRIAVACLPGLLAQPTLLGTGARVPGCTVPASQENPWAVSLVQLSPGLVPAPPPL